MNFRKLFKASGVAIVCVLLSLNAAIAQTPSPQLAIDILTPAELNGIAGDYVTVKAQIRNDGSAPVDNVTTYLSLVDNENKMPVDLEDWSAEKGLFIGSIDAGQTLPLNWKIHFVKAGDYSLCIVAIIGGVDKPEVSTVTHFNVQPKKNLNPGKVLPVALGEPIVILLIMLLIMSRRKTDE
jgi:hypothetical protein